VIFPFVLICWIAVVAIYDRGFKWRTEYFAFGFYFFTLVISSIFSINPRLSFIKLAGTTYLILLAVIASTIVTTSKRLRLSVLAWLAGAIIPIIAAFVGIALFYFAPQSSLLPDLTYHYGAVPLGNFPRISSTLISPSMFCNYLCLTLMFTLVAAKMKWIGTAMTVAIVIAMVVSALFTVSIALGGVALAVGLWLWLTSDKRISRIGSIACGVIAVAFLAIAPFALTLQPGFTASSRFLVWSDALKTFFADPLTGSGLGTAVANVVFQNSDGSWSVLTDAHNTFLNLAAQAGMPALIGMIAIIFLVLRRGFATSEGRDFYILRGLTIAFLAAFVYDGLTGSFEDARHLWILIGLILASNRIFSEGDRSTSLHSA
jgi:hypothetical protein